MVMARAVARVVMVMVMGGGGSGGGVRSGGGSGGDGGECGVSGEGSGEGGGVGENKMVLLGSKFWVSRTVRTLTIAVLAPFTKKSRRHPFSIPRPPFILNHVSLASHLIVVWTA
jgi:hypothetical protein